MIWPLANRWGQHCPVFIVPVMEMTWKHGPSEASLHPVARKPGSGELPGKGLLTGSGLCAAWLSL